MVNYLGLDIGRKRIGISRGDDELKLALPMDAVSMVGRLSCLRKIANIISKLNVNVVIAGSPLNMDGSKSEMSEYVDNFILDLEKFVGGDVVFVMVDERLTSVQAEADLRIARGTKFESHGHKRKMRRRGTIDSNAATVILQDYFNELALRVQ
jgi:putative Holliday junction resolvase